MKKAISFTIGFLDCGLEIKNKVDSDGNKRICKKQQKSTITEQLDAFYSTHKAARSTHTFSFIFVFKN